MPVSVGSDVESLSVAVRPGRAVSFVLRPAGAGCPATAGVSLTALEDFAAMIDRTGQINSEKEQPVANLAPARYQVNATKLGETCYQPSVPLLDLSAGAPEAPVPVPVTAAGAIHGKLTGTPNPAEYAVALVAADPEISAQPVQVVFPAADGRFAFGGLRPGRYRIVTQPAGEASKARWVTDPAHMIEMQIPAGAPTDMDLPAPRRSQQ
jgi:hypothetical protein